jgi:hypothetical protein
VRHATSRPLAIPYLVVGPPAPLLLHAEFAFHYRRRKRYIRRKKGKKGKRDKSKDASKQTEEEQQRYD